MLRYAWAYQGANIMGEEFPYPVQTIDARLQNQRPATRAPKADCRVVIRSRAPATRQQGVDLIIFSRR